MLEFMQSLLPYLVPGSLAAAFVYFLVKDRSVKQALLDEIDTLKLAVDELQEAKAALDSLRDDVTVLKAKTDDPTVH